MKDVGIVDIGEDAQGKTHFESKVLAGKKYGKSKMPYKIHYFQLKSSLDNLKDPFGRHPQRCVTSMTCRCSQQQVFVCQAICITLALVSGLASLHVVDTGQTCEF